MIVIIGEKWSTQPRRSLSTVLLLLLLNENTARALFSGDRIHLRKDLWISLEEKRSRGHLPRTRTLSIWRVEREIFQRPAWIKLHNKVKSRNYQNINGQLVSPRLSMLTDFRRPLFPLLFFNDYLLSVFSRTREEIREQRRSWTRSKYTGGIVSISYSKKRSNFNRYLYIYHISVQMLDARRLTRPSPPKIPSDNCYNFTVLLSYSTETQKHAQLHIDYMYT